MSAAVLLSMAAKEGVRIVLDGGQLICRADHQPPDDLLASIKAHKLELIKALTPANDPDGQAPQHITHTAATASPEWIAARDQYHGHLAACRACYAPTGRYCVTGAALRQQYQATPERATQ